MTALRTVHGKILALILVFLALAGSSFLATYVTIQSHLRDEAVVDLLRSRIPALQELTLLALDSGATEVGSALLSYDRDLELVREAVTTFAQSAPLLSPEPILGQVRTLEASWGAYQLSHATLTKLSIDDPSRPQAEQNLKAQGANLVSQVEELGHSLEAYSNRRHILLLRIQIVFMSIAGLFTLLGYLLIRQRVVRPLSLLNRATQQIKQGALQNPLDISGEDEIGQLARSFDQMRIAVLEQQTELERRVSQRTSEIATAFEFSQEIVGHHDLKQLLDSVAARACTLMRAKDASLCLVTPDGCSVELASSLETRPVEGKNVQAIKDSLSDIAETSGRAVNAQVSKLGCAFLRHSPDDHCLAAPLRVGGQTVGAMCVIRGKDHLFQEEETRAFTLLANSAAIAIVNARYEEEARRLAQRKAVLLERERLASELHDNLAQTLNLVNFRVSQIQESLQGSAQQPAQIEIEQVRTSVELAIGQLRTVASELTAPDQRNEGELLSQLNAAIREFQRVTDIPVGVTGAGPFLGSLPALAQQQLLMIISEALANVRRHSAAKNVLIRFGREPGYVNLSVEDDGTGFQPGRISGEHHLGLLIMRRRAERVGGTLQIHSAVGAGTRVVGRFPIAEEG